MTINFYLTKSEASKLDKELTATTSKTGELRDECNLIDPVIEFEYDTNITASNYAYIPAFNRFYFISSIKVTGKRITVQLHSDVLSSFKNDIKNSTGHITRSASNPNYYLPDSMVTKQANVQVYTRKIGAGFTRADKYLITLGG